MDDHYLYQIYINIHSYTIVRFHSHSHSRHGLVEVDPEDCGGCWEASRRSRQCLRDGRGASDLQEGGGHPNGGANPNWETIGKP